jgi:hypothetical protein
MRPNRKERDKMKSARRRKPLFERLKSGLEEGVRHAKGEIALKTTTVEMPGRPPEIGAEELTAVPNPHPRSD